MTIWRLAIAGGVSGYIAFAIAYLAGWRAHRSAVAGIGTFVAVLSWRLIGNVLHINGDFVPLVSPADIGSVAAGASGAILVRVRHTDVPNWLLVIVCSALGSFFANVGIL
jgi:hypothetical protein